jgi:UDP-GlcNAc3NAcA epimerase
VRIVTVVGTRPQLIKVAAIGAAIRARHREVLVDTGQHWDEAMAGRFLQELGIARPDVSLGIGGGTQAQQIGRMLPALDQVLTAERPEAVLVLGDTNSTLAGALAASTLGIPVAHVEAGLRSFDRRMPEEVNRVVADHLARWCFAPTPTAMANLAAEGLGDVAILTGDVMQDLLARVAGEVRDPAALERAGRALGFTLRPGGYLFATVHRAENRAEAAMRAWTTLLGSVSDPSRPLVLALHPGTRAALDAAGVSLPPHVRAIEPQGYRTTLTLQLHAAAVLTDSGGIQREAAWLGVPCLVLRSTSEWVEAVERSGGTVVVVGLDVDAAVRELDRLAPAGTAEALAAARAASVSVEGPGADVAISRALG